MVHFLQSVQMACRILVLSVSVCIHVGRGCYISYSVKLVALLQFSNSGCRVFRGHRQACVRWTTFNIFSEYAQRRSVWVVGNMVNPFVHPTLASAHPLSCMTLFVTCRCDWSCPEAGGLEQCFSTFVRPRPRKFYFFIRRGPGPNKFTHKYLSSIF